MNRITHMIAVNYTTRIVRQSIPMLVLMVAFVLNGCETSVTDTTIVLPYQEEIVVQGLITAGKPVENILIQRTLPPLQKWTIAEAEIRDAVATIRSGDRVWPLRYVQFGIYTVDSLIPEAGKTYQIEVQWKGKTVTATTVIPEVPVLDSITLKRDVGGCFTQYDTAIVVYAHPHPEPNVVYRAATYGRSDFDRDTVLYLLQPSYQVFRGKDTDGTGKLSIEALYRCYFEQGPNAEPDTVYVEVTGYEPAFYDYYNSKDNNGGGPFEGDPSAIKWNVTGDGFGFFFGQAVIRQQVVLE